MRGLPREVKAALEKALDSALLAVEVYNKPAVKFKSGGYIALMVIAWTSLFHAIFFKKKTKPFYRQPNRRFAKIDGDFKHWELDECLRQYYGTATSHPVRKNLEFFILLRNKIEHRSMPQLDPTIFGECQAMLLNFDEVLEREFGAKYRLRESLSFALQLFPSSENLAEAVKRSPATKRVVDFVQQFRSTISSDVTESGKYSFKAFLIQVANHKSQNALPIQFVHYDKLSEDEKRQLSQLIAMVKFKEVPVSNLDVVKPSDVVKKVQLGLGNPKVTRGSRAMDRFTIDAHSRCWRKYNVRPPKGSKNPEATQWKYCVYDKMHKDYGYTQEWVDLLIQKLKDPQEFDSLYNVDAVPPETSPAVAPLVGQAAQSDPPSDAVS
jgi:hypothetical protein